MKVATISVILLVLIAGALIYTLPKPYHAPVLSNTTVTNMTANITINTTINSSNFSLMYPDPTLTPGDVLTTNVTEICTVGYTSQVRNVSEKTKILVFQRYGLNYSIVNHSNYEVDHFISLELGGSNEIINLFPEPYLPKPGAREKDVVENYLHRQVCAGNMTLAQAQKAIVEDWYKVYLDYHHG